MSGGNGTRFPNNGTWPPPPPPYGRGNGSWWDNDDDDNNDNNEPRWTRSPDYAGAWTSAFLPDTSYVVSTCYLSFLCVVAVIMCLRSRTRLRIFACFITYIGLSISVAGLLRAKFLIGPAWFWAWNFLGEGSGVVVLALTIVSVGSGFYPMMGSRNKFWRFCMLVIVLYGLLSAANLAYYVQQKVIFRPLSAEDVQRLRQDIIDAGIFTQARLDRLRLWEQRRGLIPKTDGAVTGVKDWRELAWPEREMFARPLTKLYLGHQLLMECTCIVVVFYLFIPLVRHHRHGPIGRPVDSDMMAVGVWYLSILMTLALAYAILNIIYMVNNEFIYEQQAQALDLCLRITIGPIFFLPAPAFLLRYYRDHFRKFKSSSNSSGRNNGSAARTWGSSNNHFSSSVAKSDSPHPTGSFAMSPTTTRVDSRLGECSTPQGSFDANAHQSKSKDLATPSSVCGRLKLFQTRDRGLSVESSRVLSKDFECESRQSNNPSEGRPDSYHQYYMNNELNQHPLHNSAVLKDNEGGQEINEAMSNSSHSNQPSYVVNIPQAPKPALTQQPIRPARSSSRTAGRTDFGDIPRSSIEPVVGAHKSMAKTEDSLQKTEPMKAPKGSTGTTGWEIGGFNPLGDATSVKLPSTKREQVVEHQEPESDTLPFSDTPIEELTGLQRQLAEHRSVILPQVIAFKAYHEDRAAAEQFDHSFKSLNREPFESEGARAMASEDSGSRIVFPLRPSDEDLSPGSHYSSKSHHGAEMDTAHRAASPNVDPVHWSMASSPPKKRESAYSGSTKAATASKHREGSKSKEGFASVFTKALSGGGSNNSSGAAGKGSVATKGADDSQNRVKQDPKDRDLSSGNIDMSSSELLLNRSPVGASVKQLAELSVMRKQGLGENEQNMMSYGAYSDPYEDDAGFRRPADQPHHGAASYQLSNTPQNPYSRLDSNSMARVAALAESKSSASSATTKGGASSQSLGSAKSRESLSKNNAAPSTATTSAPSRDGQSTRPMSPKKSSSKLSSRSARSRSDSLYRDGQDAAQPSTATAPPGSASRFLRSSPTIPTPEPPVVPPVMIKTSLSPPPRQSWRRSKSFKGLNMPVATIDTALANNDAAALPGEPLSSASATDTSFVSSAQSSPTGVVTDTRRELASSPTAHRSQSPPDHPTLDSRGSSLEQSEPRVSRERERSLAQSSRLHSSRQQRSVDNLSSAYHYQRATELNQSGNSVSAATGQVHASSQPTLRQYREPSGIAIPSTLQSSALCSPRGSPPSPGIKKSGGVNSYFMSSNHDGYTRNIPSPTRHGGGGSNSTTMTNISSHMGANQGDWPHSPMDSRSQSLTSYSSQAQSRMLSDDPWTQALVNRAQGQTAAAADYADVYGGPGARPSVARTASE
ncbi:hypothetical protein BGZ67_004992 [Mortierella alpina]|nr:hypothetical protein BGZ67_004992 [Mortierella alpina]